jgi:glutaredoxin
MKEVKVEVMGPEPACVRCQAAKKVVEKSAEKLKQARITVKVEKVNIISKEIVSKYGLLVSPAIAVNGIVKVMGRVPNEEEITRLMKEAAK